MKWNSILVALLLSVAASCGNPSSKARDSNEWNSFHWRNLTSVKVRLLAQGHDLCECNSAARFEVPVEGWRVVETLMIPGRKVAQTYEFGAVDEYCEVELTSKDGAKVFITLVDHTPTLATYLLDGCLYETDIAHRFNNALPLRNIRIATGQYMLTQMITCYLARYEGGLTESEKRKNCESLGYYLLAIGSESGNVNK